ncbi:MAG: hypothetical protein WCE64_11860 [Bacteroidales bacterium]
MSEIVLNGYQIPRYNIIDLKMSFIVTILNFGDLNVNKCRT